MCSSSSSPQQQWLWSLYRLMWRHINQLSLLLNNELQLQFYWEESLKTILTTNFKNEKSLRVTCCHWWYLTKFGWKIIVVDNHLWQIQSSLVICCLQIISTWSSLDSVMGMSGICARMCQHHCRIKLVGGQGQERIQNSKEEAQILFTNSWHCMEC